ncbi:alkaline shock response membrane anchor protein AmaP [Paenibacillus xylaniclasticus]|uniref:alkaline shock response membrane anchor protein AmaP n=1 Tax=Paenibacillus xylaniclasticus TaxID=588083 RepID=UPI000FD7B40C|nr:MULTISPECIES: alkaline shock response membrane anchor protein AmaP [Paenibacillus]
MVRVMDKLLLFLYSIVVGAASIGLFCLGLRWIPEESALDGMRSLYDGDIAWIQLTAVIFAVVMFLISLRLFFISVKRSGGSAQSIDQRNELGEVRISMETVENLALKAASKQRGLKDLRARIKVSEAGLDIVIRTVVDGDTPIPTLTEEIQRSVKSHIEEITGIPVASVSVFVANVVQAPAFKSRVE